jgi:hypothetical protein
MAIIENDISKLKALSGGASLNILIDGESGSTFEDSDTIDIEPLD